ncbi:hypothetical protein V6N13_014246 [Hibiscus sabdariffa]
MAWAALTSALKTIGEEAAYLWGVEDQVKRLEKELKWMQDFLGNNGTNHLQADEIRELAYDAEDVLETFALEIGSKTRPGFTNRIKRYACFLHELWLLHETRSNIEKIIAKSKDLVRRLSAYCLKESRSGGEGPSSSIMQEQRWQRTHRLGDDEIVGRRDDIDKLVPVVVDEKSEWRVVSIYGMGGLGKTTLANKIYNHSKVTGYFNHRVRVFVSQQFQKRKVWEDILSELNSLDAADSRRSDAEIRQKLLNFLVKNKCLVILDDVWRTETWDILKPAFPIERNSESKSKILITSRYTEVASLESHPHKLQCLDEVESWELFRMVTFPQADSPDCRVDKELEELGKEMVKYCAGLPLAITALGGLLVNKNKNEWLRVSENVKTYMMKDKKLRVEDIVALSYDDLPPRLKSCFLYLSHFPEDYVIKAQRLIRLLVAEGIVPSKQEWEIAEDVAEGYLMELAERNMIEPRERDVATLKIKTFQLHDIMRDICLSKAKQENFLFIVDQSNALSSSTIREARRISAHKLFETQRIECPNLRSLSFFGIFSRKGGARLIWIGERTLLNRIRYTWKIVYNPFPKARWFWTSYIFTNLKLLRVLNYEGEIAFLNCRFIGDIGNLIHLRFLRLKNIRFKGSEFPSSLGDLICLETLDLRVSGNEPEPMHVPDVIWRMEQLRHLYLPCECDEETKLKLGTLRNLQTLVNFNTEYCYVEDLINMTNIRKLKIRGPFKIEHFDMEDLNKNPPIIEGRYLQSLSISSYTMYPRHLTHLLSSCVNISKLKLEGRGCKLPERCHLSPNLAYIKLKRCKLEEDPMPTLETLRNLRVLELHHTLERLKIHCSAQGFPKLESLSLCAPHLTEWKVNKGAMPCLRGLEIVLCKSLKGLPNGLRFITTLQELKIISMPEEFKDRVVQGGRDFHKVQHVPSVIFEDQGQCPLYG